MQPQLVAPTEKPCWKFLWIPAFILSTINLWPRRAIYWYFCLIYNLSWGSYLVLEDVRMPERALRSARLLTDAQASAPMRFDPTRLGAIVRMWIVQKLGMPRVSNITHIHGHNQSYVRMIKIRYEPFRVIWKRTFSILPCVKSLTFSFWQVNLILVFDFLPPSSPNVSKTSIMGTRVLKYFYFEPPILNFKSKL